MEGKKRKKKRMLEKIPMPTTKKKMIKRGSEEKRKEKSKNSAKGHALLNYLFRVFSFFCFFFEGKHVGLYKKKVVRI